MRCGKGAPSRRRTSLKQDRRTLRRGLRQMQGIDVEMLAVVGNPVDFVGVGEDVAAAVAEDGTVLPTRFPSA